MSWGKELVEKANEIIELYPEKRSALGPLLYLAQEKDGHINWMLNVSAIDAFIRAQDHPYPCAFFRLNDRTVKVVSHKIEDKKIYGAPGQIFQISEDCVTICCGENTAIKISKVQVDGKVESAHSVIKSVKMRLS